MTKLCKGPCGLEKELTNFSKNKSIKDGLDLYCKDCKKDKRKKYLKPKIQKETLEKGKKRCTECKEIKDLLSFTKLKSSEDGYHVKCKDCKNKLQRKLHNSKEQKVVTVDSKICSTCNINKPVSEFNKHKSSKDGLRSYCSPCQSNYRKKYHANTDNKEKSHIQSKEYFKNNKRNIYDNKNLRYKNNIQFQMSTKLSNVVYYILYSNSKYINKTVGCTPQFFRDWLKFQFEEGMVFSNHGRSTKEEKKWELDHIIPYKLHDLTNEDEKLICCHWTNVQPVWGQKNKEKLEYIQLHQFMNSIVNVHRFIQLKKKNKNGYKFVKKRINHVKKLLNK